MQPLRLPTLLSASALLLVAGACSSGGGSGSGGNTLTAEFQATPTTGTTPLTVTFTDRSSNTVTAWAWDFGDGGASAAQSPTHDYTVSGTYTVSLTVTDPTGMDTETKMGFITVSDPGDMTPPMITCPPDQVVAGFVTDPFDGSTLDAAWTVVNPSLLSFSVSGGELQMQPTAGGLSAAWFQDEEGPAVFRTVTGDFTATATVRVEDPSSPGMPPPAQFRLGGLMARDPASSAGDRNYVHVALGAGSNAVPVAAEDKSTDDSVSDFVLYPIAQTNGEVRIVRTGSMFSLQYRAPGAGSFQVLRTHNRPDLPSTLQVGPMVYSSEASPDVEASFDEVTIASAEAVVNYPPPTATDDTDPSPTVTCVPPSGSSFPAGSTMVTCTAMDASGNSAMCTFSVTVTEPAPIVQEPRAKYGPAEGLLRVFPFSHRGEPLGQPGTLQVRRRN